LSDKRRFLYFVQKGRGSSVLYGKIKTTLTLVGKGRLKYDGKDLYLFGKGLANNGDVANKAEDVVSPVMTTLL
jgi:hypothetical protein